MLEIIKKSQKTVKTNKLIFLIEYIKNKNMYNFWIN